MTPFDAFTKAADINPKFAKLAAAILAALSLVAITTGWFEDDPMTPIIGVALVLLGTVLVIVIGQLPKAVGHSAFGSTLVWFVRGILLLFFAVLTAAASYGVAGVPATFPCTIRFGADGCSRLVSAPPDAPAAAAAPAVPAPAEEAVNRSAYTVFIQFAGYVSREIDPVRAHLREVGWNVPIGERLGTAARLHEIRYRTPDDATAAAVLAADIAAAGLKRPKIRQVDIITARTLEVWTGVDVGR